LWRQFGNKNPFDLFIPYVTVHDVCYILVLILREAAVLRSKRQ